MNGILHIGTARRGLVGPLVFSNYCVGGLRTQPRNAELAVTLENLRLRMMVAITIANLEQGQLRLDRLQEGRRR